MPKFAADWEPLAPSYRLSAKFRGAALRFWQSGVPFGRCELMALSLKLTGFGTGDSELELGIGAVQVNLDGRCILSSSLADNGTSEAALDADGSKRVKDDQMFYSIIRFYAAPNPETGREFPFSACMKGYLSRLTYVYMQADLFRLLSYISDGILDVILIRSYEVRHSAYFVFIYFVSGRMPIGQILIFLIRYAH